MTDRESQALADPKLRAAASAKAEQERRELAEVLAVDGTQAERQSSARFATAFAEFKRVDAELLDLAIKNTNVKAYGLAFGPVATAVKDDERRSRSAGGDECRLSPSARTMTLFALGAETSVLRLQTLLPPHTLRRETTRRWTARLEASMAAEDAQVRKSLDGLAALPGPRLKAPELATAVSRYAENSVTSRSAGPRALPREHQCALPLHFRERNAEGDAHLPGRAQRLASGSPGGTHRRHLERASGQAALKASDRARPPTRDASAHSARRGAVSRRGRMACSRRRPAPRRVDAGARGARRLGCCGGTRGTSGAPPDRGRSRRCPGRGARRGAG